MTRYKVGSNIHAMRRNLKDETRIRAAVEDKIQQATITAYIPPSYLAVMLNKAGVTITREYIYRRYAENGIKFDTTLGLWCKRTK